MCVLVHRYLLHPRHCSENFTSSFPTCMLSISFSCLIAWLRTTTMILSRSSESKHSRLVPDLRGKTLKLSPLRVRLAVGFFVVVVVFS